MEAASASAPVVFVPLDDRPVSLQLPMWLARMAGRRLLVPPSAMLGSYLTPGDPQALFDWLASTATEGADAMVLSTDMLVYGGLVAARTPETSPFQAFSRLYRLAALHRLRPGLSAACFGTIMRLAPTGLPVLPMTAHSWATGQTVADLQAYANLPDPPRTMSEVEEAQRLRARIGEATLDAYLASRARDREVDLLAVELTAQGDCSRLVLGQDDAGPVGLHLRDVAALTQAVRRMRLRERASIEPGADELGMVLLAARFAHDAAWRPTVRVRYSRPDAARVQDPLEFAPIDVTIGRLIAAAGARREERRAADIDLFVNVAKTNASDDRAFLDAVAEDLTHHVGVAVADLTFLTGPVPTQEQRDLPEELIARGIAGSVDAFASWNTTANTVGTALAGAIAAQTGRRTGRYDATAHAEFLLDRYIDDYAFHQFVRPVLNAELRAQGIDPTLLTPETAERMSRENAAMLSRYALDLQRRIFPQYESTEMKITFPWQRTFETKIEAKL